MNGAFYIGATGLQAQQRALDVVANNIANLNTPSFKRSEVRFSELMAPAAQQVDPPTVARGVPGMSGVMMDASSTVFAQGELRQTGKSLDVAVQGEGFIELMGPAGQNLLWRGGSLRIGEDGFLAAANGMPLKAMVSMPDGASEISIDREGLVRAMVEGETSPRELGRIDLVLVKDMASLSSIGDGLYRPEGEIGLASVTPGEEGGGTLVQGAIEASNVQLSDEMVTLLLMQRTYAANAQVVQAGDQLMSIANGLRR